MLRKFRNIKYAIPVVLLISLGACKKTLDINVDPNNPTSLPVNKLLPTVEKNLGDAMAISNGLSQVLEVIVHRITIAQEREYAVTGRDANLQNAWNTLYVNVLNNSEIIINNATAAGNLKYSGIAKIIKAFAVSQLVDVFGDVPYTDALKLITPIINPKFDKGSDIYPQLLLLLDAGIADLTNTTAANTLTPGSDDVIYGGGSKNTDPGIIKWVKAANTIKLKLYLQQRLVKNVATETNALITANNLISATSESFLLPYGKSIAPDDRNPGYADYYATQRSNDISPWFYEIMKGYNQNINKNNPDPRIPYYIFNQIKLGQVAPNDNGNQTEYRDGSFVSVYFGYANGPDGGRSQQNTQSLLGIYPVGGRYDDGLGKNGASSSGNVNQTSGTGAAPYRFITYASRLFMEAELINTGIVTGGAAAARTKLQAAVTESFKQVDYVVSTYGLNGSQVVPALSGTSAVTTYINNVLAEFDAGNTAKQLQVIMTQKWIASFGSAVDAYTDYRRTGYPIIFNPNDQTMAPGGFVQPPINGDPVNPGAQKKVPVQLINPYPLTLPWPQGELEANSNAPAQKIPGNYKPFWLP